MKRLTDFADQGDVLDADRQTVIRDELMGVHGIAVVILSLQPYDGRARRQELRDHLRWARHEPLWTSSALPPQLHQEVMAHCRVLRDIAVRHNNRVPWYRILRTKQRKKADDAYSEDLRAWALSFRDWLAGIDLSEPSDTAESEDAESTQ